MNGVDEAQHIEATPDKDEDGGVGVLTNEHHDDDDDDDDGDDIWPPGTGYTNTSVH